MKQMPTVIALGGGAWLLEIARLYFVAQALGLEVSLALVAIAALSAAILSTVPVPGGVGFVESGIVGVLLLGLGRPEAVSVALVDRSITFVSVIVIGGVVFLISQGVAAAPEQPGIYLTHPAFSLLSRVCAVQCAMLMT